jgi:long-subunit acyl-CoA synthetase (AMP-forming)
MLIRAMQIYVDATDSSRSISCQQARGMVKRLAAGFQKAGLRRGDCVCMHAFNDVSEKVKLTLALLSYVAKVFHKTPATF